MQGLKRLQHVSVPMPFGGNDDARRFYGEMLGLHEVTPPSSLDQSRLVWFRLNDAGDELHVFVQEGFSASPAGQHLCLEVSDLERVRQDLESRGVPMGVEPDIHNRPRFTVRDPFANKIEITQILGPYDEVQQ
jgi:catechol 2,3-dioxygenase-like lactoylglutathione lyase family enzyme